MPVHSLQFHNSCVKGVYHGKVTSSKQSYTLSGTQIHEARHPKANISYKVVYCSSGISTPNSVRLHICFVHKRGHWPLCKLCIH